MTEPKPLQEFKDLLLKSKKIKKLVTEHYGPTAKERMKQFQGGNIGDLVDLIEENKQELSGAPKETIDGAAPDDDVFEIELLAAGPVYWIRANEFDDIGYFPSLKDARSHAEIEFESFISELAERAVFPEEDEEAVCPFCQSADSCKHHLLSVDVTFRQIGGGALYEEFTDLWVKRSDSEDPSFDERKVFEELLDEARKLADSEVESDFEGGPGQSSANIKFYCSSPARVRAAVRAFRKKHKFK